MCDNPAHSHGRVNPNRLGEFHKANDLSGIQVVVNLRGATYCCGLERTGYLPVLFRLQDERLFYGRYSRNGLLELRSPHPGTTLLQMSDEDAQIQCEKEEIPFQDLYCEEDCSSSKHADDSDLDRQGFAPNPSAASSPESGSQATPQSKPSLGQTKRMRLKPGDASIKIIAALDSLADRGEWKVSEKQIYTLAHVSRSTYYDVLNRDPEVQRAMKAYHAQRLGRGPLHANDV